MSPVWNKCDDDIWSLVKQPSIHVTEWCCPSLCPVQKSRMEAHNKVEIWSSYCPLHVLLRYSFVTLTLNFWTSISLSCTWHSQVQCTFVSRAANPTAQCCWISRRASVGSRISQREGHVYLEVMLPYRSCFSCILLWRHLYVMNIFVLSHFLFFFIIL